MYSLEFGRIKEDLSIFIEASLIPENLKEICRKIIIETEEELKREPYDFNSKSFTKQVMARFASILFGNKEADLLYEALKQELNKICNQKK